VREINDKRVREVAEKARAIRRHIVTMLCAAGSGHTGGSLSASDIVACLYFWEMNLDPANPDWEDRDRFVLSKGHAAPVLYAALAERGFFPRELLMTLRKMGSPLQGHPDKRKLAGVEASTGSLGQGISWARFIYRVKINTSPMMIRDCSTAPLIKRVTGSIRI
jgi:transketolase